MGSTDGLSRGCAAMLSATSCMRCIDMYSPSTSDYTSDGPTENIFLGLRPCASDKLAP